MVKMKLNMETQCKTLISQKKEIFCKELQNILLAGIPIRELQSRYNLSLKDLKPFLPILNNKNNKNLEVHYLGYYLKWIPQRSLLLRC